MKKLLKTVFYLTLLLILAVTITIYNSGDSQYTSSLKNNIVNDITQLNPIYVAKIITPHSETEIIKAIKQSKGPISIGGGRYSMGGQTAFEDSLHLDMREYNKVISFSKQAAEISVESGITWRKLQQYIDTENLSVKIMQTYANFTVGGSMSVNVHGRYIGHGPLISSIKSFKIVLADGSLKTASSNTNPELYYAAIGGYGGIGVITQVTLHLAKNSKVERSSTTMPLAKYHQHFKDNIRDNKNVIFHNADLYPPNYDTLRDVSWHVSNKDVTINQRLIPENSEYTWLPKLVPLVSSMPFGTTIREHIIDPIYYSQERIAWRNWEASYDVRELGEGDRSEQTYVLQEYFIPVNNINSFIPKMRDIYQKHDADIINVSIRHALADSGSYLAWAREEVFAFVVYYRQETDTKARQKVAVWTSEITDAILSEGGTYYLPYQPHASIEQFNKAYPNANKFFAIKRQVDPDNRFTNKLWEKYYPSPKQSVKNYLNNLNNYNKGEEQTYLTIPEWYLVFNPNEYVNFLKSGNNPSDFPFFSSINEYWTLYDKVNILTAGIYPENKQYNTMLKVIGISTTAEYLLKGAYENTLGRFTRWTASTDTPEDLLIIEAHQAYADLIFNEAWYQFPFMNWVSKIWTQTPIFGANFMRKIERKISFTLEFSFKAVYAKLIGFGAQQSYEESDGLVTVLLKIDPAQIASVDPRINIIHDFGDQLFLVTLPRWGAFTQIIPKLAIVAKELIEINGNDDIAISTLSSKEQPQTFNEEKLLFTSFVASPSNKTRYIYSSSVKDLKSFLSQLSENHHKLEHAYDY